MRQRLLSLILVLSLTLGFCPVFAAEESGAEQSVPAQTQAQTTEGQASDAFAEDDETDQTEEQNAAEDGQKIYIGTASQRSGTAEDAATNAGARRLRAAAYRSAVGDPNLDYVDQLSDNPAAQESYKELKTAFEKTSYTLTDEGVAEIQYETQADIQFYSETDEPTSEEKSKAMKDVFLGVSAFRYDHPEVFYLDPQCRASYGYSLASTDESGGCYWKIISITLKIQLLFTTVSSLNNAKTKYNDAVSSALSKAENLSERDEKVRALHDWLCNQITYESSAEYAHSSYGALVAGECVCEGYAKALKVLCDKLNIPCKMVLGTGYTSSGSDAHMWNYVRMEDGVWYAVDATWDDQTKKIYDDYFLVGSESVSPAISKGDTFSDTHVPTGYFTTDTTTMEFRYPTLAEQAYVREIELESYELDLVQGRAYNLTATLLPKSSVKRPVSWSSDDEAVVTVNENGRVTAEALGSAVISVTAYNGCSASCLVNVHALEAPELISAEMLPEEAKSIVRWEESNGAEEYIVFRRLSTEKEWTELDRTERTEYTDTTVQTDLIYYYTVCAVAKDGKNEVRSRYDEAGVVCFASGIALDRTELEMEIGETDTLTAFVKMDGEPEVTWSSSDTERVTVDETGKLTALRAGIAVITAQAEEKSAQCTVSILPAAPKLISAEGGTVRWNAVEDAEAYLVYRKITGEKSWTLLTDENGIAETEYTDATVEPGGSYHYTVRAVMHVDNQTLLSSYDQSGVQYVWEVASLSKSELRLKIGKTATLTAEISPATELVTWTSSNSSVASVDQDGTVTANGGGMAKITLTGEHGAEASCTVLVTPEAPKLISAANGTVRWKAVSGAASYRVYRRTAGGSWKRIAVTKKTSYTDRTAKRGNAYDYTVRAYFTYDGDTILSKYDKNGVQYVYEKVTLPEELELNVGKAAALKASITPAEAADIALTWTSSDSEIVSVDKTGTVFGNALGSADITVSTAGGATAVCTVKVSAPAPELLSAENGVVKWSPVKSAQGYLVYRRAPGEGKWTLLTEETGVTETQYTDTTAEDGAVAIYTVRARMEQDGESILSACDPIGVCSVPLVGGIEAQSVGWNSVSITWDKVKGASAYRVYRKTASSKWKKIADGVTDTAFADSGLTTGTEYIYTIRAYYMADGKTNVGGYDKNGVSVKPVPATVELVSATAGSGSITVKWNKVSGASGYNIYRKTNGGGWKIVKTVGSSTTSWKDTGLTKGATYTYTVRAYRTVDGTKVLGSYDHDGVSAKAK